MAKFHERSPFYRVLANPERVALLDVFLTNETIPVDMDALMKFSGLPPETIDRHLHVLMTAKLVEQSEDGELYRLHNSDAAQALCEYHTSTHDETLNDVIEATDAEGLD